MNTFKRENDTIYVFAMQTNCEMHLETESKRAKQKAENKKWQRQQLKYEMPTQK